MIICAKEKKAEKRGIQKLITSLLSFRKKRKTRAGTSQIDCKKNIFFVSDIPGYINSYALFCFKMQASKRPAQVIFVFVMMLASLPILKE
jgi:hypothetical protein